MVSYVVSRVIMLVFGTLYPAYASYKAMKTKNVREYVRWMMYWIVFALFITAELFADLIFGFWFPFYYELKIIFMLWLLLPASKDIDSYIEQLKESGYVTFMRVSKNSLSFAADTMIKTAATGQSVLAEKLRQYGTDHTDNPRSGRLLKAKSWYGGMNLMDNDYKPIDETEEYSLIEEREEEEEESVRSVAESPKLNDELTENPEEFKTVPTKRSYGSSAHRSSTLPRSYGRTTNRPRVYGSSNNYDEQRATKAQPRRSGRNKQVRTIPVSPGGSSEAPC
ncbi:receptor expression-enhancing protein 2-like isoform X3 [Acropora muricata]|uniref:receptor expression-enhancing protein 2-like isoform X3 n=1 Tax=Acropora muricata TaxID=159855 RepID=UPI0034E522A5